MRSAGPSPVRSSRACIWSFVPRTTTSRPSSQRMSRAGNPPAGGASRRLLGHLDGHDSPVGVRAELDDHGRLTPHPPARSRRLGRAARRRCPAVPGGKRRPPCRTAAPRAGAAAGRLRTRTRPADREGYMLPRPRDGEEPHVRMKCRGCEQCRLKPADEQARRCPSCGGLELVQLPSLRGQGLHRPAGGAGLPRPLGSRRRLHEREGRCRLARHARRSGCGCGTRARRRGGRGDARLGRSERGGCPCPGGPTAPVPRRGCRRPRRRGRLRLLRLMRQGATTCTAQHVWFRKGLKLDEEVESFVVECGSASSSTGTRGRSAGSSRCGWWTRCRRGEGQAAAPEAAQGRGDATTRGRGE